MVFSLFGKRDNKSADQKVSNEPKKSASAPTTTTKSSAPTSAKSRSDSTSSASRSSSSGRSSSNPASQPGSSGSSRSSSASSSSSSGSSSGRRTRPSINPEIQRELARATAAKIDAIESEMALDFGSSPPPPPKSLNQAMSKPVSPVKPATKPAAGALSMPDKNGKPLRLESSSTLPPLDATTSIILGDETGALAFEINTSLTAPIVEEVAILYANGQAVAASLALAGALKQDDLGSSTMQAWLMLFDLYRLMNKREEFEGLAIDFVSKFEISPPAWHDDKTTQAAPVPAAAPANGPNSQIVVVAALNENLAAQIQHFDRLAQRQAEVVIDLSNTSGVTAEGAKAFLDLLRKIAKAKKPEVGLQGAEQLLQTLLASVETGRRDPTEDVWMLLLEMYRLLGQEAEFEEASINYCITYEVSPPSWEAPPSNIKTAGFKVPHETATAAEVPVAAVTPSAPAKPGEVFDLEGELEGNAEVELSRLMAYAENHGRVHIQCNNLRRVDFTAAGALLNALVGLQASGRKIEFMDLNHLVAALFIVMGIHQFAALNLRKI